MNDNIQVTSFARDKLAAYITDMWIKWDQARISWKESQQELRAYLFATDTSSTTNNKLPWKNSTVTPKLTQIRDNLHANYMAALFPSDDWFIWESGEKTKQVMQKRAAICAYMKEKLKASNFQLVVSQLVYDYIDYGNVFVTYDYVRDVVEGDKSNLVSRYVGPKAIRLSPNDIVFNPLSSSFSASPMLRRMLKSVGDLLTDVETKPGLQYDPAVVQKVLEFRANYREDPEFKKEKNLAIDGFGSFDEYVNSDMVEIIEFWGDVYDSEKKILLRNQVISIVDRQWILRSFSNPHWTGEKPVYHCGWRLKPDNLWAQGPLDQLVGLQYRIDHLENLKADVFDIIAYPVVKVMGTTVEEFEWEPGAVVFCGDEGDVDVLKPDATALNADMQIAELMQRMEELAGAPKQAMGIRTPGEKTKYEVQTLENAAGRIFQSKVSWFEKNILEPLLNGMLAEAIRHMDGVENIRYVDEEFKTERFMKVTKEDLSNRGKLYPVGARHFAEQAKFVQELSQTIAALQAAPTIAAHISGKAVARALEENLGWKKWNIVQDNAAVFEQQETQRLMNQATQDMAVESTIPGLNEQSPTEESPQGLDNGGIPQGMGQ